MTDQTKEAIAKFKMSRYIGKLPWSKYPWRMSSFEGKIYLANEEHPVHIIVDEYTVKRIDEL